MTTQWGNIGFAGILSAFFLMTPVENARAKTTPTAPHKKLTSIQTLESARDFFGQGDYGSARKHYLEILAVFPRNFELLKNLGYCYFTLGPAGLARAVHFYSLAHEVNPDARDVTGQLAKCLSELNMHKEAAAILRQVAETEGAEPESWKNLAQEYDAGHHIPDAVSAYQAYLRRKPDDAEARTRLGILNGEQTAYTKALEEFQIVLTKNPDFAPALIGLARIYSWQGRFVESLRLYDHVLNLQPVNGEAASGKAFALLWMGRTKEAEVMLTTLHQRFPQDAELSKGLENARAALAPKTNSAVARPIEVEPPHNEAYFRERLAQNPLDAAALIALTKFSSSPQRCSESIEFGRQAIKLSPDDPSLELSLANSLSFCRQYGEAIRHYRHYLRSHPQAEGVFYELAQALLRSNQTEESISVLESLLKLDPANSDARLNLAQAHAALGQYREAIELYDELLSVTPDNYDALQGKAFVLYWTKHFAQARVIFESTEKQLPSDRQNSEALQGIDRAEEQARWDSLRPAPGSPPEDFSRYFEKRLASYPDDVIAMRGWAQAQAQLKTYAAAIRAYQQLSEKYPEDVDARLEWARLLGLNGQTEESIKVYQRIVEDHPAHDEALVKLAGMYGQAHRPQEAVAIYKKLSARYPTDLGYKLETARLELALHDYPAARDVLASVLFADPRNHEARIGLAQLELSEGAWDASLKHFSQLLKEDADDPDALMGKARITYYKGNLEQAQSSAELMVKKQPRNFDAIFLLANIENARGNHRGALALLDQAAALTPKDEGVLKMKEQVSEEARVTITTSAAFSREIGPPGACFATHGCGQTDLHEDLRSSSLGTTIQTTIIPRTESFFSFASLPTDSPLGRDSFGVPIPTGISGAVAPEQFLYRQSSHLNSQLVLRVGGGWIRFGPGIPVQIPEQSGKINSAVSSALAQAGVGFTPSRKLNFNLDVDRSAVPYSPTSVRLGVMESRVQVGLDFFPTHRTEIHADFFFANFDSERFLAANSIKGQTVFSQNTDHDQAHGGSVTFNSNIVRAAHLSFDAGFASQFYGFSGQTQTSFMGFFNPGFFQSQLLTTRIYGRLWGPISFDFSDGVGVQQTEHSGALTRALNLSPGITLKMSRKFFLTLGYTHYNTGQSLGTLRGNAVRVTTIWKD
ncbi:MAG TPA: tetratricopeptide repeat protein [Terriglobia bacterium]|nr:tetratricopeptide repeat protein [Terriglobia bacterium]